MPNWIEIKARYDKITESGAKKKVTEAFLVDALSCTEAEARVIEELSRSSDEINITSAVKTKIADVFLNFQGDRYYKVKVNFIALDERTAEEKKSASYIIVRADSFEEACANFKEGMKGTMADYETESVSETKIVEIYPYVPAANDSGEKGTTPKKSDAEKEAARMLRDPKVVRQTKKFMDACADGGVSRVEMSATDSAGNTYAAASIDIPKPK